MWIRSALLSAFAAAALAPAAQANAVEVVDVASGATTVPLTMEEGFEQVRWSIDGQSLLGLAAELRDGDTVDMLQRLPVAGDRPPETVRRVHGFQFLPSPDGTMVAEVHDQGRANVVIRDVATGRKTATLAQITRGDTLYRDGVRLGWSPDGRLVAVASYEKKWRPTIRVVDARTGRIVRRLRADARLSPGSFTADGARLAFVANKRVVVADLRSGAVRSVPGSRRSRPQEVAWSPDGTRLAVAARRALEVVDPVTGEGTTRPYAPEYLYDTLAWTPDGAAVVYGLRRGGAATVVLADPDNAAAPRTLVPSRSGDIHGLRLSPSGDRIALTFWPTA